MTMFLTDRATIEDAKETPDGRIVGTFRVSRGGNVQEYLGSELGMADRAIVRLYRPESEVFARDSMASFPHKLVTLDHPGIPASFDKDGVGWIGEEVVRDGEFVRVPMVIASRNAVDAVKAGKQELSVGYGMEIVFEDGISPKGEPYDAKMSRIVVDHVAIVDRARGGSDLRVGDWRVVDSFSPAPQLNLGGQPMADNRKIVVDGLTIETTVQGAEMIEKLQGQIKVARDAAQSAEDGHKAAIAAKDAELAKKYAEIERLTKAALTDAQLDARVADRAALVATAKAIAGEKFEAKGTDADVRRAVVAAKLGDAAVEGKSAEYIAARFDILAEDAKGADGQPDPVRQALQGNDQRQAQDNGQAAYEQRISERWKTAGAAKA